MRRSVAVQCAPLLPPAPLRAPPSPSQTLQTHPKPTRRRQGLPFQDPAGLAALVDAFLSGSAPGATLGAADVSPEARARYTARAAPVSGAPRRGAAAAAAAAATAALVLA
jgi:hypothetical protein